MLLLVACARTPPAPTQHAPGFHYDAATGTCRDAAGKTGHNAVAIDTLRATGAGECADLRGVQLLPPSTGDIVGWDLRGADLTGASLHFSRMSKVDLRGADLSTFDFGYVFIDGTVDRFTRLPDRCTVDGDQAHCAR